MHAHISSGLMIRITLKMERGRLTFMSIISCLHVVMCMYIPQGVCMEGCVKSGRFILSMPLNSSLISKLFNGSSTFDHSLNYIVLT